MIGGTRTVGRWTVTVDLAGVTAGPLEGSDVYRTTAIRFPRNRAMISLNKSLFVSCISRLFLLSG